MNWESATKDKLEGMIIKIPVFHRRITQEAVTKRAEENARSRNASSVQEQDVVGAFFADVPSPFYSMMIRLLDQSGYDYRKYGFPKNGNHKR